MGGMFDNKTHLLYTLTAMMEIYRWYANIDRQFKKNGEFDQKFRKNGEFHNISRTMRTNGQCRRTNPQQERILTRRIDRNQKNQQQELVTK